MGVDGEGINLPDGTHRYVMLSVGDDTLFRDGEELQYPEILRFLYDHFRRNPDKNAAYVGFFLGYDFTHWFKGVTLHEATMLFTNKGVASRRRKESPMPFPVYLRHGWEVDMLGMKRLRFRPHVHVSKHDRCGCGYAGPCANENPNPWHYVCDTGAFFQAAFVKVIDPAGWHGEAPCTQAEFDTIVQGKAKRSDKVTLDNLSWAEEMAQYNRLENRILAEVMRIYNGGFAALGVRLGKANFYGPGQAAQKWLNSQVANGARITREMITEFVPADYLDIWRRTYYGGRFEIFYHGIVPGVSHEYDIQSAYPDAIRRLPCLCGSTWAHVDTCDDDDTLAVADVTIVGASATIGALPHRTRTGAITYPRKTRGWYRWVEIVAARDAGLVESVEVHDMITATYRCRHAPPLAALAGLFEQRLAVGKATPHGKALKLVYNSVYGKMAQSIGEPKYANAIYASIITSGCRIRLLQAIGTHPNPDSLVMTATDGIYFAEPHPDMPTVATNVESLGEWEAGTKSNLTLMKPGVYWDDKARTAIEAGKAANLRSRGISGRELQKHIMEIDEDFRALSSGGTHTFPTITISMPFAITSPRLALARGKWETAGQISYDIERQDSAVIAPKRERPYPYVYGLMRSYSPDNRDANNYESQPYNKYFGFDPEGEPIVSHEYYTPDGTFTDAFTDAFGDLRA